MHMFMESPYFSYYVASFDTTYSYSAFDLDETFFSPSHKKFVRLYIKREWFNYNKDDLNIFNKAHGLPTRHET